MTEASANGSLTVVGSGIKFIAHLSTEAITYIRQAEKLLYSVNEPAMENWLKKSNSTAESLDNFPSDNLMRKDLYSKITQKIITNVKKPQHVCVVFYGHPSIFAKPALNAVLKVKQAGFDAKILPAISGEDCLFADLCIDPGSHGCQSFEATDFLIRKHSISSNSHLILWQVGFIGALADINNHNNQIGLQMLLEQLKKMYPEDHRVFSYEAALYSHLKPTVTTFDLKKLPEIAFSSLSTLYIPPLKQAEINLEALKNLNIGWDDL